MSKKPSIAFVVAMSRNYVIGINNRLPWRLPDDMRRFRALTWGKPVLMGRKTYESLPDRFRPLPGRHNIILTHNTAFMAPGCSVVHTLSAAFLAASNADELLVIGGAAIFELLLPLAHRLYLTLVDGEFVGDVFFPKLNWSEWREVARQEHAADERHAYHFTYFTLERVA